MNRIEDLNVAHVWSVLCLQSTVDEETNELSMFKILEELNVTSKEKLRYGKDGVLKTAIGLPVTFQLITLWQKLEGKGAVKFDARIEYVDPSGISHKPFDHEIAIPAGKTRARHRFNVSSILVNQSGQYLFKISARDKNRKAFKHVTDVPLTIVLKEE
jgi:hypothetical protein